MAASDIRAGGAFIELSTKNSGVLAGLEKVEKKLKALGSTITAVGKQFAMFGGAVTAGLLVAAQRFASMGDEVNKASQRTGVAVDRLSALKYAADQSGSSLEEVEKSMLKMSKAIVEATQGSASAKQSFKQLGISVDDLTGKSPDEQFLIIAEALSKVTDANQRAAYATDIFGKSGANLLPLISGGAKGIDELTQRAKDLGLVIGGDDAEAATAFGDILDDLWKQIQAVTFQIGAAVAKALQPFAEAATRVMAVVINWIKENRSLVVIVLAVAAGVLAAGVALIGLGTAITLVGTAIGGIISAFGVLGTAIGALLSPIALVVAAVVGIGIYLGYAAKAGNAALSFLSEKFNALKDIAGEAFGGIADALAAGDIALAAKILWVALQSAWMTGTAELQKVWQNFKAIFVQTASAAFFGTLELWQTVKSTLMTAFESTTAFLGGLWDGFIGTFSDLWNTAINAVAKGLNWIKGLWDDTFDSEAANAAADAMLAAEKQKQAQEEIANATKRTEESKKAIAQIEADRVKAVKEINDREMAISEGATTNAADAAKAIDERKKALEDELAKLRATAAEKKALTGDTSSPNMPAVPNLDDMSAGVSKAAAAGSGAIGLFNVAALQSLMSGGSSSADRTAKATEDTARNTARMLSKIGGAFV